MYDDKFDRMKLPLYPDVGGLFPFMIDYSGSLYCWRTERNDPSEWPVICWFTGQIAALGKMSIAAVLLGWLERRPKIAMLLGDVGELPEERLKLS
jgi:hypothetical protein